MTVTYSKETIDRIIAIISDRPGVIHFHVANELGLKPRELDKWLRTVGTQDYRLLHHEERWWTTDPRWIETASMKKISEMRKALNEHRGNYLDKRRVTKQETEFQRKLNAEVNRRLEERQGANGSDTHNRTN